MSSPTVQEQSRSSHSSRFIIAALAFAAVPVSGASAASLTVALDNVDPAGQAYMSYRGTADAPGIVSLQIRRDAADCPAPADRAAAAAPDFETTAAVGPGAFSEKTGGPIGDGTFVLCGYLDQNGGATVAAAPVPFEYPPKGRLVRTSFNGYFSTGNRSDLQFNASCHTPWGFCTDETVAGRVSVTLTPAARRKVGLKSGEILKGPLKRCGMGTGCAMMAFSPAVERKMDAAERKADGPSGFGTLKLKARVTVTLTAPLERRHSAIVTFGNRGTIRFSCATSMRTNECTDGTYGEFLTGDGIDR